MAVHTVIVPDCPDCGAEMRLHGKQRTENGKVQMVRWYECPNCHKQSPKATDATNALKMAIEWLRRGD